MASPGPSLPLGAAPDWVPADVRSWNDTTQVRKAAGSLRAKEKYDFQRACLPYLQTVLDGDAIEVPEMGGWDAAGIDHLAWAEDGRRLRAVVQCKGFGVAQHEIGGAQAAQCVRSIRRFQESGLTTDAYVLLHNRENKDTGFHDAVTSALIALQRSGAAGWVDLWDRKRLLGMVCARLSELVERAWRRQSDDLRGRMNALLGEDHLTEVPLSAGTYHFSGNDLVGAFEATTKLADPAHELMSGGGGKGLRLLLGGFGYGKTAAALRISQILGREALYIPAALLRADHSGGRALLRQVIDPVALLEQIPDADMQAIEPLAEVVSEKLLRRPRGDILLVVDGLDEAPLAHRRNGVAQILNEVSDVRVPVLLTMRTEFWHAKHEELAGALSPHPYAGARMSAVELRPWADPEIRSLIARARSRAGETGEVEAGHNLSELLDLIGREPFAALYEDIPRRPLFLQLLISDVAAEGVRRLDPVTLMDSWVARKLRRDLLNPELISPGGDHRPPLVSAGESLDTALARSWDLMDTAAGQTLPAEPVAGTEPDLGSSVRWDSLVAVLPWLETRRDLGAVSTQTLLLPLGPHKAGRAPRLVFAHRAFQEFFAARHVLIEGRPLDGTIPPAVREWTGRMSAIGYP
ncbi:hypothetical protein [Actinomadura sp. DC4]|uniref:hypothetical protein n=1 Tax=Actinomadura sp. DC4 TaxID=3055069 RepID=UPI0025AF7235|nr:hypothetical protein [Actinomadura sp. DC4]MDN3355814.1 hypothetical protein [Actinomadura sp. DC4]